MVSVLALNSNSYFLEAIHSLLALGGGNNFVTSFCKRVKLWPNVTREFGGQF